MALPDDLRANGWFEDGLPWCEFISKAETTQDAAFGCETGNQAVMTITVFMEDAKRAIKALLGSNVYDKQAGELDGKLSRIVPMRHPIFKHLHAMAVTSYRPFNFVGKSKNINDSLPGASISSYEYCNLTIVFKMPPWHRTMSDKTLEDLYGLPKQEWRRFVSIHPQPQIKVLSRTGGSWTFDEIPREEGGPPINHIFPDTDGQILPEMDCLLTWHRVPGIGLLGNETIIPDRFERLLGHVNDAPFMGRPRGTLLFRGWGQQPLENCDPYCYETTKDGIYTPTLYNITFALGYWNPPRGNLDFFGDPAERGWNLFPWTNNLWYIARDSQTKTRTKLPYGDFKQLFTLG